MPRTTPPALGRGQQHPAISGAGAANPTPHGGMSNPSAVSALLQLSNLKAARIHILLG
ncbi:MAG: hypothetical protein ACLPXZ_07615 [Mycobacterium sp.]